MLEVLDMDQGLIDSDAHDSEYPYHSRESQIISGQGKHDNSSSERKENAANDDDGILDIIELDDEYQKHENESDHHRFAQIL